MEPFDALPPPANVRQVAATLYAPGVRTLPLADVFDPAAVHILAAAPALLAACGKALALIRDHWPIEHGQRDVGEAWGALVAAINAAHPPHAPGASVMLRVRDGGQRPAIVQRVDFDADTGDRTYTVYLTGPGYSVFAGPHELTARGAV